jgi:3-deoxy-D-manno-octulosonic-acid transferase
MIYIFYTPARVGDHDGFINMYCDYCCYFYTDEDNYFLMLPIYNIAIHLYYYAIYLASFFNKKAKLWINGRSGVLYAKQEKSVWFHFASLGEFEQGRPVLENLRKAHPGKKFVITFFSPSGYEIRKNTPLADAVYYLPLDTAENAHKFIETIQPELAIFTKYEYWYHFFNELHQKSIPLYVISGIFRPKQIFFKWYGGLNRKILSFVTWFFVQDDTSAQLLQSIGITNVKVSGDTRFDRVWANAQQPKDLPLIKVLKGNQKLFIAGSTWPADEKLIKTLLKAYPNWKFIISPHEIAEYKIEDITDMLIPDQVIRYTALAKDPALLTARHQLLVVDNIGMLSSLYQYGDIAYIGGGFGAGIHNTLEAAAFGVPVIFGPNYKKFKEAKDLIAIGGGFSIKNEAELQSAVAFLVDDESRYKSIKAKVQQYVQEHTSATETIVQSIKF